MKIKWKYSENIEATLRCLDEKIEEIKEWYENRLPYAHSREEYDYYKRSYYETIQPYLNEKIKITERICPKMIITTETTEEMQEILKRLEKQS